MLFAPRLDDGMKKVGWDLVGCAEYARPYRCNVDDVHTAVPRRPSRSRHPRVAPRSVVSPETRTDGLYEVAVRYIKRKLTPPQLADSSFISVTTEPHPKNIMTADQKLRVAIAYVTAVRTTATQLTRLHSGGGISGLSLAICIAKYKADVEVDIYESGPDFATAGAGLGMWPRIWDIMRELGLEEELKSRSTALLGDGKPAGGH